MPARVQSQKITGPVSRVTSLHEQIRDDILCGELKPGAKLRIETMQNRYGIGSSPLREALTLLVASGLVDRLEQRGFRVAHVGLAEFEELLSTRCFVEERAAYDSVSHGDEAWEDRLSLATYKLERASKAADPSDPLAAAKWEELHTAFHSALISACPSRFLLKFCAQLYDEALRYRNVARMANRMQGDAFTEHKAISDAALARDAELTAKLLVQHFQLTGKYLRAALSENMSKKIND